MNKHRKRPVVIDTDTANEIDDQFALAYAALSPEALDLITLAGPVRTTIRWWLSESAPRRILPTPFCWSRIYAGRSW